MLKISRVGEDEWVFDRLEKSHELAEEFDNACELLEMGETDKAEKTLRSVLAQSPDHIDAIHHLAMILSDRDMQDAALDLWEQAVRIGRKAFPGDFKAGEDRLEWGWLENRPFLRSLHGLALAKYGIGEFEGALMLFNELLSLNPNDNLGARALAIEIMCRLGKYDDAVEFVERYFGDLMPDVQYGRALAYFKIGRKQKAVVALKDAIASRPLVAKELLKVRHRMPKSISPYGLTMGGADEAYEYWERWGTIWSEDAAAMAWLRRTWERFL